MKYWFLTLSLMSLLSASTVQALDCEVDQVCSLLKGAQSKVMRVRAASVMALGNETEASAGDAQLIMAALETAALDPDPTVRLAAEKGLKRLHEHPIEIVEWEVVETPKAKPAPPRIPAYSREWCRSEGKSLEAIKLCQARWGNQGL